jgi:ATP-dependent DNA ligase
VLDGEVAIYDQQLRSRFDWLREPDPDAVASPSVFMAFDLLNQDRRDRLEILVCNAPLFLTGSRIRCATS